MEFQGFKRIYTNLMGFQGNSRAFIGFQWISKDFNRRHTRYNMDFTCRYINISRFFRLFKVNQEVLRYLRVFQWNSSNFKQFQRISPGFHKYKYKYQKYIWDLKGFDWVQRNIQGFWWDSKGFQSNSRNFKVIQENSLRIKLRFFKGIQWILRGLICKTLHNFAQLCTTLHNFAQLWTW